MSMAAEVSLQPMFHMRATAARALALLLGPSCRRGGTANEFGQHGYELLLGHTLGASWEHLRGRSIRSWEHLGNMSGASWDHVLASFASLIFYQCQRNLWMCGCACRNMSSRMARNSPASLHRSATCGLHGCAVTLAATCHHAWCGTRPRRCTARPRMRLPTAQQS